MQTVEKLYHSCSFRAHVTKKALSCLMNLGYAKDEVVVIKGKFRLPEGRPVKFIQEGAKLNYGGTYYMVIGTPEDHTIHPLPEETEIFVDRRKLTVRILTKLKSPSTAIEFLRTNAELINNPTLIYELFLGRRINQNLINRITEDILPLPKLRDVKCGKSHYYSLLNKYLEIEENAFYLYEAEIYQSRATRNINTTPTRLLLADRGYNVVDYYVMSRIRGDLMKVYFIVDKSVNKGNTLSTST